jgi:hypothetical protein
MRNGADTMGEMGAAFARRGLGGETFRFSITNAPAMSTHWGVSAPVHTRAASNDANSGFNLAALIPVG